MPSLCLNRKPGICFQIESVANHYEVKMDTAESLTELHQRVAPAPDYFFRNLPAHFNGVVWIVLSQPP
jgi:hypothetical protein